MKAVWDLKSQFSDYEGQKVFDCLVAEFLLSEGRYTPTQELAFEKYHVSSLEELAQKQQHALAQFEELHTLFATVELPLVSVLAQMEKVGIMLDVVGLQNIEKEIVSTIEELEKTIFAEMGQVINLNSAQQVGTYLVEKAGVPLGKTKTGKYATNENELAKYAAATPIIQQLLSYRELKKLHSTYIESLIGKVDENNRLHTTYHQTAVSTGRLASTNPNLQNIPVNSEYGLKIKSCFIAGEGRTFLSFDYSQQELRILAHLTREEKLINAYQNKQDVHKITSSQIFSVSYDEVTKEQRQVGKTINFGIIYGMSSYGLSEALQIPVDEAQAFIDTFYATYPKIRLYYENYLEEGKKQNVVSTLLGRRRYVNSDPRQKFIDNATRRVLMNYPIQGSGADLMKLAMVRIKSEILDKTPDVHMLLQIHDDLLLEVPDDTSSINEVISQVREIMRNVYPLVVSNEVDVKIGKRWGEMKLFQE